MRILIAEDDEDLMSQYVTILQDSGHQIIQCKDGNEAICLYDIEYDNWTKSPKKDTITTPIDIVLLDYKMPTINGMDVAKNILKKCKEQRILFASAYLEDTLVESLRILHKAVELLQKPFPLKKLVEVIEDHEIYKELKTLNVDIGNLKEVEPTHEQIQQYAKILKLIGNS